MQLDDSSGTTIEVTCGRPTASASTNNTTAEISNPTTDGKTVKDGGANDKRQTGVTATGRTIDLTGVDVGAVVKVKGGIGMFRGAKQVQLERICTFRPSFLHYLHHLNHPSPSPQSSTSLSLIRSMPTSQL